MPSVYIQSSVFLPTPSGGAGAVELLVAKMAEGLAKRGWDVTLFALEGSRVEGVHVTAVSATGDVARREQQLVTYMAKDHPPDVIFDHSLHMFAGQRRGPYVAMSHGMAALPSWAHNVVFTSQHHGRLHGRKDPKALLLGIDLADIPQATGEKREGLFWAGRIMPYKRLHLACEIARLAEMPLRVAGPIIDEKCARRVWDDYDIHDQSETMWCQDTKHVHYLGELPREVVLREMARARYFLFTSDETEPAGLTMLEAMACGTPVIALAGNAAVEYVAGGGWIVPDAAFAAAHLRRLTDTYDDATAGRDARAEVEESFTIDHMVTRAEDYLRRAIAGERW